MQIPTTTPNIDHEKFIPTADIKEDQAILTNSMKLHEKFMEILGEEQNEENFKFMVLKWGIWWGITLDLVTYVLAPKPSTNPTQIAAKCNKWKNPKIALKIQNW